MAFDLERAFGDDERNIEHPPDGPGHRLRQGGVFRSEQLHGHGVFAQDRLARQACVGADADDAVEFLVLATLDFGQALFADRYFNVAGVAFAFAAAFAEDLFADGLEGCEQAGAGGDFVGFTRRKNGECGHGVMRREAVGG